MQTEITQSAQVWMPSPRQERFLALPDSIFEALYGGAAFGGKSEVLGLLPIVRKLTDHPRFKFLLLRRTYPELDREIIPRMMEYYKSVGATWNDTKKCWKFPSGAMGFAGHMEHEEDKRKYDTDEYQYIGWDEVTSFTESQYLYVSGSRCRSSIANLPAFVRAGTNPGNTGHDWVKKRFKIEEVEPETIIKDKLSGNLRIFIPALPQDNIRVPAEKLQAYLNSLELLDEHEKQAKKYGSWNSFEGQVFGTFRKVRLTGEPDNALHVIPPFEIPKWWPTVLAMDWGFAASTYAVLGSIAPDKRVYLHKEYCEKNKLITEWVPNVIKMTEGYNLVDIVIDPSAKQKRGEERSIFEQVYDALKAKGWGSLLRTADNDRVSGKILLQEFLRFKPLPFTQLDVAQYDAEYAQHLLRWQGSDAYNEYLSSFNPPEPEVIPRLQMFDTCKELINVIPRCIYDKTNKEDVAEFDGDDPYDTIRYFLKAIDRYYKLSQKESNIITARSKVIEHFEQTKDYNALARNVERLGVNTSKSIRRYHNARVH